MLVSFCFWVYILLDFDYNFVDLRLVFFIRLGQVDFLATIGTDIDLAFFIFLEEYDILTTLFATQIFAETEGVVNTLQSDGIAIAGKLEIAFIAVSTGHECTAGEGADLCNQLADALKQKNDED